MEGLTMFKITSKEWEKRQKDHKSIIDGKKYILVYDNGTCLKPVEIDDTEGKELRTYQFEECYLTYNVLAWDQEDALKIALSCGHSERLIQNMRLKE